MRSQLLEATVMEKIVTRALLARRDLIDFGLKNLLQIQEENLRIFTLTLAIFLLWFGSAVANDGHDHLGECEIEEWRWDRDILGSLIIEGSTTCASGSVTISLYKGTGEFKKFIGTADGVIERHAFSVKTAFHVETKPSSLSMIAVIAKKMWLSWPVPIYRTI